MSRGNGNIALVTGATGGLGTAMCRKLAQDGYKVAANYRNREKAEKWLEELNSDGVENVFIFGADVTDFNQVGAMVKAIEDELGPVDIVVNNAGITRDNVIMMMKPEDFEAVLRVNLTAITDPEGIVVRHFLDSLRCAAAWGATPTSLIDIGSGAGFPGIPLKILHPSLRLTLVESVGKKAAFLRQRLQSEKPGDAPQQAGQVALERREIENQHVLGRQMAPPGAQLLDITALGDILVGDEGAGAPGELLADGLGEAARIGLGGARVVAADEAVPHLPGREGAFRRLA